MISAVIEKDKKKYEKNPSGLACFLPVHVHSDTPKLELRNVAFHTLENNVTVNEYEKDGVQMK